MSRDLFDLDSLIMFIKHILMSEISIFYISKVVWTQNSNCCNTHTHLWFYVLDIYSNHESVLCGIAEYPEYMLKK
jgi:hypothetical protein